MFAEIQTISRAGRSLRFVEDGGPGAGRALVLVHAFPVGVGLFAPQRGAFEGWRLVAPVLPGFDGSAPLADATMDDYAAYVLALLDALAIERAVFGGVSLGGYVTCGVLRVAADRVSGLVLADTRSAADSEEARDGRRRMLALIERTGPSGVAAEMLPRLVSPDTHARRPEVVAEVRAMIERQSSEGLAAAIHALMTRSDATPLLADVRVPTLALAGEQDVLTPPEEMERMAAAIPGARFGRLAGAGHLANLENPTAFNRAVAAFLRSVPEA